jgi:hypothetical protein
MADWLAERREFGIVCTDQLTFRDAWRSAMSPTSSNSSRSTIQSLDSWTSRRMAGNRRVCVDYRFAGGAVAQLGEHYVRNVGVEGSNPFCSTIQSLDSWT